MSAEVNTQAGAENAAPPPKARRRSKRSSSAKRKGTGRGRPRKELPPSPVPYLFTAVLSFLQSKLPGFFASLAALPDIRKSPETCVFPALQLHLCVIFWMLTGARSGLAHKSFLVDRQAGECIARLCENMGCQCARNPDGTARMPTVDTLKDLMEALPPQHYKQVWKILVGEIAQLGLFRGTRFHNMPIVAIDGVDGFRSRQRIDILPRRKTGGTDENPKMEYVLKHSLASLCPRYAGAGFPIAAAMVKNDGTQRRAAEGKQQCEYNMLPLVLEQVVELFPALRPLILLDGLYTDGCNIRLLVAMGLFFAMVLRDDDLDKLHQSIEEEYQSSGTKLVFTHEEGRIAEKYELFFCNGVKHDFSGVETPRFNYVYAIQTTYMDGEEKSFTKFSWITNIHLSEDEVVEQSKMLRRRWGVETLNNDLKNLALNLTHKFDSRGNGPENFSTLMFMAGLLQMVFRDSNFIERVGVHSDALRADEKRALSLKLPKPCGAEETKAPDAELPAAALLPNAALAPGDLPLLNAALSPDILPLPNAALAPGGLPLPNAALAPGGLPLPNAALAPGGLPLPNAALAPGNLPLPNAAIAQGDLPLSGILQSSVELFTPQGVPLARTLHAKDVKKIETYFKRASQIKREIAKIRMERRWHTRDGFCECLRDSMLQTDTEFKIIKIPPFTMLWNLINQGAPVNCRTG